MRRSLLLDSNSMDESEAGTSELHIFMMVGLALVASRIMASVAFPVYDDAFITFAHARNLAAGSGLVYHTGEWVLGTTAPLFGLVCSLFYLVSAPMPQSVVVLNILLDLYVLFLTIAIVPRHVRPLFALVFGVLFSLTPIVARISVGGMEPNLFLACSVTSIFLYLRGSKRWAFGILALSYYLRPEALLLLGILAFMQIRSGPRSQTLALAAIALTTLAIPSVILFAFYGQILPQSVIAKSNHLGATGMWNGFRALLAPGPVLPLLFVPAVWGVFVVRRGIRYATVVLAWALFYLAVYFVARPKIWSWYGIAIYYGVILWATVGIVDIVAVRLLSLTRRLSPVFILVPVMAWMGVLLIKGPSAVRKSINEPLRAWCAENINDPKTTIAASDIGVIGYYSGARIYDLVGLVWPDANKYPSWQDAIRAVEPQYLFLNATSWTARLMSEPDMAARYMPIARFNTTNRTSLTLDTDRLPGHWVPDYIIFQRR